MMGLIRYRPKAPLDRYVDTFWWSHRDRAQLHGEHMLPCGSAQMIFVLHEESFLCQAGSSSSGSLRWSRSVVHGPQGAYFASGPKPVGTTIGVAFRPGGAGPVLGCPVAEFADNHVPAEAMWGARARDVREQLLGTRSPTAAFRILEAELIRRLDERLLIHPAVAHALRAAALPSVRVANVQQDSGYSPRHFVALFREAVGLNPKHYFRIQRFTDVLRQLASSHPGSLADIAALGGYADQAHLTRDFREFSGTTPTRYRPAGDTRILHHRTHDEGSTPGLETPRLIF